MAMRPINGSSAEFERLRTLLREMFQLDRGARGAQDAAGDRGDAPQVLVGLAVTREGFSVRHWVFPGNTVDVSTVAKVLAELEAEMALLRPSESGHRKQAWRRLKSGHRLCPVYHRAERRLMAGERTPRRRIQASEILTNSAPAHDPEAGLNA